jgi:putative ABC transport system permease protein
MRRMWLRLWHALRPSLGERELEREIGSHLALLEDEFRRRGSSPEAARAAARRALGSTALTMDRHRDARSLVWIDDLRWDLAYAARLLQKNPLFALTASLSLAIGIGANTTIVTIANALLLRPPAGVAEPDALVDVSRGEDGKSFPSNFTSAYPYYRDVQARTTTFAGLYGYELDVHAISVGLPGGTEYAFANAVTTNYFSVLGVAPAAGRLFGGADRDQPGASPVVVLSHRFWMRSFGGDASVVGRELLVNRQRFTVIGVADEGFRGTNVIAPDAWVPMGMVAAIEPGTTRLTSRVPNGLGIGGRLRRGISRAEAAAELDVIAHDLEREHPVEDRGTRLRVARLSSVPGALATVAARLFAVLLALVSVVLVIASANIAGVLLARAAARRREMAVRAAIGAGPGRLARQLLGETLLLFAIGGAAGLGLARVMTSLLLASVPGFPIPIEIALPLDLHVFGYATVLALVAAVLAGLAPALHVGGVDVVSGLKHESSAVPERMRTRSSFVVAQVALSIMLVVVAGLLLKALQRVSAVDRGFDAQGVEAVSLDLDAAGYTAATGTRLVRDVVERLRELPHVQAAAISQFVPGRGGVDVALTVPGTAPPDGQRYFSGTMSAVDDDYFATLRLPLIAGRAFTPADRDGTQPVVIVSEAAARRWWPGQPAVGKFVLRHGRGPDGRDAVIPLAVVGVARDVSPPIGASRDAERRQPRAQDDARATASPALTALMLYVPFGQQYASRLTVLTRSTTGRGIGSEVRAAVRSLDPQLPMLAPQPLESQTGPVYLQLRIAAAVAGGVGLVGLLLAAIGIYGLTAYTTARRTRELGIRVAMGAQRRDIVGMILGQGLSLVVIGAAIGLGLALAASRLFTSLLFGVPPFDPPTFVAAAALFAAVGIAACYLPCRRALSIDAVEALRYD